MRVLRKDCGAVQLPPNSVYIGRPSKWGNPFVIGVGGRTRQQAIDEYRRYLWRNQDLMDALLELAGKNLVCHCAPLPCHGDVLKAAVAWKLKQLKGDL